MNEPSIGCMPYGFHEAGRSEYAAQYALSSFGNAIPVPRQEDCGYDLHCGVGEREGRRLLIRDHYYVQVKSTKEDLIYPDPDSVRWLVSLACPLFVAVVDKANGIVELFQTVEVPALSDAVQRVRLTYVAGAQFQGRDPHSTEAVVHLGQPVLRIDLGQVNNEQSRTKLRDVLGAWVRLGHEVITERRAGALVFGFPGSYEPNVVPENAKAMSISVLLSERQRDVLDDRLLRTFSVLLLGVAHYRPHRFDSLFGVVGALFDHMRPRDSWGLRCFTMAMEHSCRLLKRPNPWRVRSATEDMAQIVDLESVRVTYASEPAPRPSGAVGPAPEGA